MAGPEVTAKLGLDVTAFKRALTATQADVGKFGNQAAAGLERSFGAHHIGKSIIGAFGLADIHHAADTIARFITGISEESEKAYKSIEESSTRAADIQIENMERLATAQNRQILLSKQANKALKNPDLTGIEEPGLLERAGRFLDPAAQTAFGLYAKNKEGDRAVQLDAAKRLAQENSGKFQAKADELAKTNADKLAEQKKRLADATAKYNESELTGKERINAENDKGNKLFLEAQNVKDDEIKKTQLLADAEEAYANAKKISVDLDKEQKKAALDLAHHVSEVTKAQKKQSEDKKIQIADVQRDLDYNKKNLQDTKDDRGRLTLSELANIGRFDSSGLGEQGEQAREYFKTQQKAEELRSRGDISGANVQFSKADQLAKGLEGTIKSSEANPFKAAEETLIRSEDQLKELNRKLAEVVGEGA